MNMKRIFCIFIFGSGILAITIPFRYLYRNLPILDGITFGNSIVNSTSVTSLEICATICSTTNSCVLFTVGKTGCYGFGSLFPSDDRTIERKGSRLFRKHIEISSVCEDGFITGQHGDICYKAMEGQGDKLSWKDAMEFCMEMDSVLFNIENEGKLKSFLPVMQSLRTTKYWTGGFEISSRNSKWIWWNGETVTNTLWRIGEPNNHGERCLTVDNNITANNDMCFRARNFICERYI